MNLSKYIIKDNERFYFDLEGQEDSDIDNLLSMDFQDGDKIIWSYEGQKYVGVLRAVDKHLFVLDNVCKK